MADFDEIKEKITDLNDTDDSTASYDPADIEKNKGLSILAYFSWLVLIPLICAKDSKFARFHCNQGILLAIAETAAGIVLGILGHIKFIGWIFGIVGGIAELAFFVLLIIGVINAANGKAKDLPVIGSIRLLK